MTLTETGEGSGEKKQSSSKERDMARQGPNKSCFSRCKNISIHKQLSAMWTKPLPTQSIKEKLGNFLEELCFMA